MGVVPGLQVLDQAIEEDQRAPRRSRVLVRRQVAYDWAVQDLAEFGARVFLTEDVGDATRAESVETFIGLFGPRGEVEAAFRSDAADPGF
jgi:hypothetical protein